MSDQLAGGRVFDCGIAKGIESTGLVGSHIALHRGEIDCKDLSGLFALGTAV